MKNLFKIVALSLFVTLSADAFAQKFGRIDSQNTISLMQETKDMQANLEAFSKDLQEQMEAIQVEFNQKYTDFQKNAETMSESVKQMKQQELQQIQERYQAFNRVAEEDFTKKQRELLEPIQKKFMAAVEKVAKNGGFAAIFDTSMPTMLYFDQSAIVDVAAEVKAELGIKEEAAK